MTTVALQSGENFQGRFPPGLGTFQPPVTTDDLHHGVELETVPPGEFRNRQVMPEQISAEIVENACSRSHFPLSSLRGASKCLDKNTSNNLYSQHLLGCMNEETIAVRLKALRIVKQATQSQFANYMGVTLNAYQRYEKGSQIPGADKLAGVKYNLKDVNTEWLLVGEGQMLIEKVPAHQVSTELPFEICELLGQAQKVLLSDNPIAFDALARNIKYFAQAVDNEKRLKEMESRLVVLEQEVKELRKKQKPDSDQEGGGSVAGAM